MLALKSTGTIHQQYMMLYENMLIQSIQIQHGQCITLDKSPSISLVILIPAYKNI